MPKNIEDAKANVVARYADLDAANQRHHAARVELREADTVLLRCEAAATAAQRTLVRAVIAEAKDS